MRLGWVIACLGALVPIVGAGTACTPKPPPGFAGTNDNLDSWTFPLIGPLENSLLFVPVSVNDKGPFLFALDPDATVSVVDEDVVKEGRLRVDAGKGPRLVDESGTPQPRFFAEVLSYEIGPLVVQGAKPTLVVKAHTFDFAGRRVYGVLGHDVLLDTLALSFDRDAGTATLTVLDRFKAPDGATAFKYTGADNKTEHPEADKAEDRRVRPLPRKLIKAVIAGQEVTMHVDLGGVPNLVREPLWSKLGLQAVEHKGGVIDEVGSTRETTQSATAPVLLGTVANEKSLFVPYIDKRWPDAELDGVLGLDFFKPFDVAVNWDTKTFYLAPRKDALAFTKQRMSRWNDTAGIAKCEHPGCVTVRLIDPLANKSGSAPASIKLPEPTPAPDAPMRAPDKAADPGQAPTGPTPTPADGDKPADDNDKPGDDKSADGKPGHPGLVLSVLRDPVIGGMDFEVVLAAVGKPSMPWLIVNLSSNVDRVMAHLSAEWLGVTLQVIDISPYPRRCPGGGSCIDKLSSN